MNLLARISLALLIAASLLPGGMPGGRWVCIGDRGTFAVESADADACCDGPEAAGEVEVERAAVGSRPEADRCLDVPVPSNPATRGADAPTAPGGADASPAAALPPSVSPRPRPLPTTPRAERPPRSTRVGAILSSTILRL